MYTLIWIPFVLKEIKQFSHINRLIRCRFFNYTFCIKIILLLIFLWNIHFYKITFKYFTLKNKVLLLIIFSIMTASKTNKKKHLSQTIDEKWNVHLGQSITRRISDSLTLYLRRRTPCPYHYEFWSRIESTTTYFLTPEIRTQVKLTEIQAQLNIVPISCAFHWWFLHSRVIKYIL